MQCLTDLRARCGSVLAIGSPLPRNPRLYAIALGAKYNRQVLGDDEWFRTTSHMFSGPPDSALKRIRQGLSSSRRNEHRRIRELMKPQFAGAATRYADKLVEVTHTFLDRWKPGQTIDIWQEMLVLSRQLSNHALFGREPLERLEHLGGLIQQLLETTFSMRVWLCPFDLPGSPFRQMLRLAEKIETLLLEMIAERRANPAGKGQNSDALEMLVHARDNQGQSLTDAELVGQLLFLYSASYETTATALSWTWIMLSQHPHVARQLADEARSVMGSSPADAKSPRNLVFTEQVLKESMRLLPPVPVLPRVARRSVEVGGLELHKSDRILVSPYFTHRTAEVYEQPLRFNPARWSQISPTSFEYLPFGAGPRYCIGASFAMVLLKLCTAMMAGKFRLSLVPGSRIDRRTQVVMRPRDGVLMTISKQDGQYQEVPVRGQIHQMVEFDGAS